MTEIDEKKMKWTDGGWYGETAKQEAAANTKRLQPSMQGKGYEPVMIIRDDVNGDLERDGHPGYESLKVNEVPMFLLDKFREAAKHGHLPRTYRHLTKEFKRVGVFDEKISSAFEKFNGEVEKATHYLEQKKLFEEVIAPYIGKISMKKNG